MRRSRQTRHRGEIHSPATWNLRTEAFVERAGKWAREDVSATETYASLIGAEVLDVELVQLPGGKVVGAIVQTRGGMVRVEADEVYVDVA